MTTASSPTSSSPPWPRWRATPSRVTAAASMVARASRPACKESRSVMAKGDGVTPLIPSVTRSAGTRLLGAGRREPSRPPLPSKTGEGGRGEGCRRELGVPVPVGDIPIVVFEGAQRDVLVSQRRRDAVLVGCPVDQGNDGDVIDEDVVELDEQLRGLLEEFIVLGVLVAAVVLAAPVI